MELASKLKDAALMFWQSLDAQERIIVGYALSTVLLSLTSAYASSARERRKAELAEMLEELTAGGHRG